VGAEKALPEKLISRFLPALFTLNGIKESPNNKWPIPKDVAELLFLVLKIAYS